MKSATKEFLSSFFTNNYQYHIPFFQRSYVWTEDNWVLFWENMEEELIAFNNQEPSEHFIGTIITKQLSSDNYSTQPMELVDGQQRLTTIALVLKALADTSTGEYPNLAENTNKLLKFQDSKGNEFIRIKHSKVDSKYFEEVMNGQNFAILPNHKHPIIEGYKFFMGKLRGFPDAQRDDLKNMLLNRFPVISMLLEEKDDEQEIFDTINSLGVRLSIGELLKNFVFRDDKLKPEYPAYWFEIFENDEETIQFWDATKTAGRTPRTNLELLLYCFLIIETGDEIRLEKLYKEYKKFLKDKSLEDKIDFLKDLKNYASDYQNFPSGTELNEIAFEEDEKRLFHVIQYLEITTVYPLLLYIYRQVEDREERKKCLKLLESYLVRRTVCKLSSKNYNRLFIGLINGFKNGSSLDYTSFSQAIFSLDDDTNRMPSDEEFQRGFRENYLYNKYAREVLFCISLYHVSDKKSDVSKLSVDSYSVEHILPKKWESNWSVSGMTETMKDERHRKLKTLGNLTLVTGSLNSKMKNAAWKSKKKALRDYSKLKITTEYLDKESWDETEITSRSNTLANDALKIWKVDL